MPRTGLQRGPGLAIELDSWQSYEPGDMIIGRVIRTEHLVSPDARLTVKLHGRAKSKMIVQHTQGKSVYRGRFTFFGPNDAAYTLFKGLVHIAPQGEPGSWNFAIAIPMRASAAALAASGKGDHSFIPLEQEVVDTKTLPGIFYCKGSNFWSSTTLFGYVEYYLEAELVWAVNGKQMSCKATLPLLMRHSSAATPLPEKTPTHRPFSVPLSVRSYRLLPGVQAADLSLGQKTRTAFGSSKVPAHSFAVQVECPIIIEIGKLVPFLIRVLPDMEKSSEALRNVPIQYRLASFDLTLKATTTVICAGTFTSHDQKSTEDYDFHIKSLFPRLANPILLPAKPEAASLNLGHYLQILLDETRASVLGQQTSVGFKTNVYSSFETYNIRHTHVLEWEFGIQVVGLDDVEYRKGEMQVTLVTVGEQQRTLDMKEDEMKKKYENLLEAAGLGLETLNATLEIVSALSG